MEKLAQFLVFIFFKILFYLKGKPKVSSDMEKTINLYKNGKFSGLFAQIRAWDAPFEEIEKIVPKTGLVVDLGCGDGLLANYLAITRFQRKVIGIELDPGRIKEAQKGLKNTTFWQGDVLVKDFPKADAILLIHLLHHLPSFNYQKILLNKCKNNLKKGGLIIIAEIDKKPLLKYLLTWFVDAIIFPVLFERKIFTMNFFYNTKQDWEKIFTQVGLKFKSYPASKNKPFSHIIFKCWR